MAQLIYVRALHLARDVVASYLHELWSGQRDGDTQQNVTQHQLPAGQRIVPEPLAGRHGQIGRRATPLRALLQHIAQRLFQPQLRLGQGRRVDCRAGIPAAQAVLVVADRARAAHAGRVGARPARWWWRWRARDAVAQLRRPAGVAGHRAFGVVVLDLVPQPGHQVLVVPHAPQLLADHVAVGVLDWQRAHGGKLLWMLEDGLLHVFNKVLERAARQLGNLQQKVVGARLDAAE